MVDKLSTYTVDKILSFFSKETESLKDLEGDEELPLVQVDFNVSYAERISRLYRWNMSKL